MDWCVSKRTSNVSDDFSARDKFLGKNRSFRPLNRNGVASKFGDEAEVCLDPVAWSSLPEELLILVFARLPVQNILQMRSLSKSWRSTITSPEFQQAFSEASLVRISLVAETYESGTIYFSQPNREEAYRPSRKQLSADAVGYTMLEYASDIVGTTNGLICVLRYKIVREPLFVRDFRVIVMNLVTGISRELPSPRIKRKPPTLVQMKANVSGGYTITFMYTKNRRRELQVTSWQVYDSVTNVWSDDEGRAIADFKDVEVLHMGYSSDVEVYYDVPATFHKETKVICVFNLYEGNERYDPWIYPSNPNGHVHNVSGELYKLCTQEGRHGVWRLVCSSKWEMVCECPDLAGLWTCLRVMNDLVVLIIEIPVPDDGISELDEEGGMERDDIAHGGIVKVFHMPTKVWYSFPEDEHFTACFCYSNPVTSLDEYPFLVEIRFDSIP